MTVRPINDRIRTRLRPTALKVRKLVNSIKDVPAAIRMRRVRGRLYALNVAQRGRRVVFVSERPSVREAKLAFGLKRAGWDVILLHRSGPGAADPGDFCETVEFSSPWQAVEHAHHAGASLFHVFAPNCDDTCLRLVDHKPGRVIIDFHDHMFSAADGLPEMQRKYAVDIDNQRHCLERADAVCCRDLQMQYRRAFTRIARGRPIICFPEYCWNIHPLPEKPQNSDIHIVQVGWMGFETRGEHDAGCLHVLREFVEAGCFVHIYLHPAYPHIGSAAYNSLFADYLDLASKTGRVVIHPTVSPQELVSELTPYNYGFGMSNALTFDMPWRSHNPRRFPYCGASRMFDYLDAGLGMLVNRELAFMLRTFRPFHVMRDGTELVRAKRLRAALAERPTRQLVLEARAALSIDRQIGRLTRFYESLA
jgi:hypothetical protein